VRCRSKSEHCKSPWITHHALQDKPKGRRKSTKQVIELPRQMTFLEHIDELRRRLLRIFATVIAITLFSFLFGFEKFHFGNLSIYLPYPNPFDDIAALLIRKMQRDLLPQHVKLIVTSPGQAIVAQLYVSILLGIVLGMPMIAHQIAAFVGPALYPRETRAIRRLVVPAILLFFLGATFTYLFITSIAFEFLYAYGVVLGAETFITVDDLVSFVLLFALAGGLSFQLPVVMWIVTVVGLVDADFWRRNLSYAIVGIVIFGAVVTPDGSGITMWLISMPMILLYFAAYFILRRRHPLLSALESI